MFGFAYQLSIKYERKMLEHFSLKVGILPHPTLPPRTLHHPANPLYSIIILSHPFSTPGHFSSHVLQPSHVHHCTTSLDWPTTWIPHHFFTSTTVIANHKTSSSSASSIRHPTGLPLKIKMSTLQTLLPWLFWSFTFSIWTTPTLTATLSPPDILEIGPELLLKPPLETPFIRGSARE